jgi:hypothetical protein
MKLMQDDYDFLHILTSRTRASVVKWFFEFNSNPVIQTCNFGYYSSTVGWLTALQARNSRVHLFAGVLLGFFIFLILPVVLWVLGPTWPLKQRSTANISWVLRRTVRRADNLITFMYRFSWVLSDSDSCKPQCMSRPVQGLPCIYVNIFLQKNVSLINLMT